MSRCRGRLPDLVEAHVVEEGVARQGDVRDQIPTRWLSIGSDRANHVLAGHQPGDTGVAAEEVVGER